MLNSTTTTAPTTTSREARRARNRRLKAILAGGLVLGVGAAVTLAAWNDSEFAQGTFTAGAFNLEGSTDGDEFADNADLDTPAELAFTVPTLNLAPEDEVSAAFAIRLDETTTNPANAVISAPTGGTSGSVANLTYSLTQTDAFGCDEDVTEILVPAATAVGSVPGTPTVPLAVGADDAAGESVFVCFTVTAGPDLVEGQTGTATWQFLATSVDVTPLAPVVP